MQLVINTFGASLRKQGDRFLVKAGAKQFAVSAHKVQSILLTTGAHLSTDAIELASAHNIDLVFLSRHGDPYARIWQAKMGSTAAIRRRQIEVADGPEGLAFVRDWVQAKLRHQADFLDELRRRRPESDALFQAPLTTLRDCLAKVGELSGTLDEQRGTLMGLEGSAGRAYFACLGQLVPENFRFEGRSRHPARDEFNAMLNYSYGVLYALVEKACICAGLDPFVGFLLPRRRGDTRPGLGKLGEDGDMLPPENSTYSRMRGRPTSLKMSSPAPRNFTKSFQSGTFDFDRFVTAREVLWPCLTQRGKPGKPGGASEQSLRQGCKFRCGSAIGHADLIAKGIISVTNFGRRGMAQREHSVAGSTLERLKAAQAEIREEYLASHRYPWIIGYSGGKDSTLLAQLVFEMLLELAPGDRNRPVHILCNDTLVESPILMAYINRMLGRLQAAAETLRLPIVVVKTTPDPDQTFWVNLIGRGYPAPTRMFRWCTDRMKIAPTSDYIRSKLSESGEVILLLGVRRAESANRAVTMNRHQNVAGSRLNPHDDLIGCMVFRPLIDMSTDDVWLLLLQRNPPWGGSHRELVTLYRNAQGGECPLVIDKSQAPSCGTSSSRFGCWTCTVVEKDRSMEGFIEAGFENMEPLMEFRDWLAKFRNERAKRMIERRDGRIVLMGDGVTPVAGPFTLEARQEILTRLLAVQEEVGMPLISADEIARIKMLWAEDAVEEARRHLKQRVQLREREQT